MRIVMANASASEPAPTSAAVPSRLASPKKKKPIDDDLGDEDDLKEITSAEIEHEKARLTNNNRLTGQFSLSIKMRSSLTKLLQEYGCLIIIKIAFKATS